MMMWRDPASRSSLTRLLRRLIGHPGLPATLPDTRPATPVPPVPLDLHRS